MEIRTIKQRTERLFSVSFLQSLLRISQEKDNAILENFLETATDFVEQRLGKTILTKTWKVVHDNNAFYLPRGPVIKVQKIVHHKNEITDEEEIKKYISPYKDTLKIEMPYSWKVRNVEVEYIAGFGDSEEDVPAAIRHAVLGVVEYLYDNPSANLEKYEAVWLRALRTYDRYIPET